MLQTSPQPIRFNHAHSHLPFSLSLSILTAPILPILLTTTTATSTTVPLPPQLPLQPPRHLRTNTRVLVLPHPAIPIPFPAFLQIPINDAAAHALPARAGADEVPGAGFQGRCGGVVVAGDGIDGDGPVDLAAHEDVSGFVAEGAGFAVGFWGFGLGHDFPFGVLFGSEV